MQRGGLPWVALRVALIGNAVLSCPQTAAAVAAKHGDSVIVPPPPFTAGSRRVVQGASYHDSLCLELGGARAVIVKVGVVGSPDDAELEPLRAARTMARVVAEAARANRKSCFEPPPCPLDDPSCPKPPKCPSDDPRCERKPEPIFPSERALVVARVEVGA